ncbi:MAG: VOC family protein [Labedaea sp.]
MRETPNIFAALRYADAEAAIDWLTKAFGFEEKSVHRNEDGTIGHAELRLGVGLVMLGTYQEDGWLGGGRPDPLASTISIYVVVEDPAAHHDRARAEGAVIVRELEQMDYGSLEYSVRDPEGNLWSFGTYNPYAA